MALPTTEYFENELRAAYDVLCGSDLATTHLSGTFRWDGTDVEAGNEIELDGRMIESREFAQLLMIFSDSRVHEQAERRYGPDDSPPGTYYTAINPGIVHEGHKNRVGIYVEEDGPALFIEDAANDEDGDVADVGAVHVDHFYLREQAPDGLGSLAFALSAMVAHRMGYKHISVVAGGGVGHDPRMIGYKFWPKVGFDAELEPGETDAAPHLAMCRTIQDVIAVDEAWWEGNGSQRWMEFDLAAGSPSWRKLLDYLHGKEMI
ncbi:hypothetical protein BJN34_36520 (plasmid) [Cupriavidus necator]|uniref:Uncharacterized protein n=1 Tax=Cupriavidus necator TaxID=106590 RepID=A0A1U9V359_CUPNE|nr:hypothetical protein [Cupriavidus necator]AQV99382.1 hypothetical protein BJN34_36520 [Cupriavidus necator]